MNNQPTLFFLLMLATLLISSCEPKAPLASKEAKESKNRYVGLATEDSVELTEVRKMQDKIKYVVQANAETDPVAAASLEDAADDPAIWVNKSNTDKSIVFGSNKRGGIIAYDLNGVEMKYYPTGNINNIDILDSISNGDTAVQLLGCSNRTTQGVDVYFIALNGELIPARNSQLRVDDSVIDDVYGFCFGTDKKQQKDYLFVNGKNGIMLQYEVQLLADTIELTEVRMIAFDSQTEGMAVDNKEGILYVGEENKGIWKLEIDPVSGSEKELMAESTLNNSFIEADIEGLTIADNDSQRILIASSQGNFSYAMFNLLDGGHYLGSIKVSDGETIDGAEETDGVDVKVTALGSKYPQGVFVVQDGYNFEGDTLKSQNFKYIDFREIQNILNGLIKK